MCALVHVCVLCVCVYSRLCVNTGDTSQLYISRKYDSTLININILSALLHSTR